MTDPTFLEMYRTLWQDWRTMYDDRIHFRFDACEAIYWFANDWHGGGGSNLYSALSTNPFTPSPIANGPEDDMMYDTLESVYVHGSKRSNMFRSTRFDMARSN